MSSLSDAQQIHSMLQQISALLDEVDTKTDKVSKKVVESYNKIASAATKYLVVARKAGLPEPVDALITKASQAVIAINQLILTLEYAQAALLGAGPVGWLVLGASAAYTALSFYSIAGG